MGSSDCVTAKIAARMLFGMAIAPPTADPVTLVVEGDRLMIERSSTLCAWVARKRAVATPGRKGGAG
jgi:hypothetical protein